MKKQLLRLFSRAVLPAVLGGFATMASAQSFVVNTKWTINPGDRSYVTAGTTERGIAISPVNNNVFIVSRAAAVGNLAIYVLDGETGAELLDGSSNPLKLDTTGITGGALVLNSIGVADDGVIYACNVATATNSFKIYRWADVTSAPQLVFGPTSTLPTARYGDGMDVRGSGANTQIIVSGPSNPNFAVFTTVDGTNFTANVFPAPSGVGAGELGKGIAFGVGDTVFGKKDASTTLRNLTFSLGGSAATLPDITMDNNMGPIDYDPGYKVLGGLLVGGANDTSNHKLKIYNLTNSASPQLLGTVPFPSSAVNDTLVGGIDFNTNKFVAVDPGNGVVCVQVDFSAAATPPTIILQPQSQTVLSGGFVTFSSDATGSDPLRYQWYSNSIPMLNATNKTLFLKPVYANSAADYYVVVTNSGGSATSDVAVLTIDNSSQASGFAEEVWSLGAGTRTYLTSTTRQRGMAYNPGTDSLLVASGAISGGPPEIFVLNAATGADKHKMNMTGVTGGYFPILGVAAAEDGVVYAANLMLESGGSVGTFKIYRWQNDSSNTVATVAYGPGDPWTNVSDSRSRFGDTINVRGSGTNTQIICAANTEARVVIFTTTDGLTFTPHPIAVTNCPIEQFRLGVAFGSGDTFWGKGMEDDANGRFTPAPLRNVAFNLNSGLGEIVHTYQAARDAMSAIGVEVQNDILAGLNFGTPDSIKVFDISDLNSEPPVMDQDFYATDNANQFLTGAFDSGGGRLYSLNTGNGLLCLRINTTLPGITKQPVSLTNAAGTRAIFSVKSTGYPRNSRWQFNGVDIPDAKTSTLTIHDVRGTNAGNYRLIITNTLGAVTSSVVNLRVTAGILTNPVSQIVNSGDAVTVGVVADGEAPLSYQWRLNGVNVSGGTNSSLVFPSIQATSGGEYSVVVTGPLNVVTSTPAMINVLQSSTPGDGTGLTGEYWSQDTGHSFPGTPTVSRVDPQINFQWYGSSPDGAVLIDDFTARWSGQIQPLYSQEYTFHALTDDGVRLWINNQQIINRWSNGSNEVTGKITLTANQKYNIIMEYYEATDDAIAELRWSSVSQLKDLVPTSQLYPTLGTVVATPVPITLTRNGNSLVFNWTGSFSLQSSTNLAGPYTNVGGATSPYTNSVGPGQKFFRLISN